MVTIDTFSDKLIVFKTNKFTKTNKTSGKLIFKIIVLFLY